ncbi:MAG: lamin tail domain-containing protein, partial [Sedimentisphaerales bacterium]|nr:lamin tail domain-containing protein [Sedimentisphaerales bacterium]
NAEFIELTNIGAETINLNLVRFTEAVQFIFPDLQLAPGQYVLLVKDRGAFDAYYPECSAVIAGEYEGSLDNAGERIRIEDAIGRTILDFEYKDGWYDVTDGDGYSLTIINPSDPDANNWGLKDAWRPSALFGGSPGYDDTGIVPNPGSVVINEVLAHSHGGAADWIELHNTTGAPISIGGWFLSDSDQDDLSIMKYRIADGTTIEPNGYIVFYEDQHFGSGSPDLSGAPFALSENGDKVVLTSAVGDVLTGYRDVEDFDASETDVSFGRYRKSGGTYNFVPLSFKTPGSANAYPMVGPIVINEIMYNPDPLPDSSYDNDDFEYIELHNISDVPVTLYDAISGEPWKFTDGIEFSFPTDSPVTVPAGGYLLIVKNPEAFAQRWQAIPASRLVGIGPYEGRLDNSGEKVEIGKPGDVDQFGTRYYIRVDRVNYSDGSHPVGEDLWPSQADGGGKSLTRKVPQEYGNDVVNWKAADPSPGAANP